MTTTLTRALTESQEGQEAAVTATASAGIGPGFEPGLSLSAGLERPVTGLRLPDVRRASAMAVRAHGSLATVDEPTVSLAR